MNFPVYFTVFIHEMTRGAVEIQARRAPKTKYRIEIYIQARIQDSEGGGGFVQEFRLENRSYSDVHDFSGIEFKDFILGFRQSTFLCTTLKCIEKFRIPFIKSGIPASNLGFTEAQNHLKFAACFSLRMQVIIAND